MNNSFEKEIEAEEKKEHQTLFTQQYAAPPIDIDSSTRPEDRHISLLFSSDPPSLFKQVLSTRADIACAEKSQAVVDLLSSVSFFTDIEQGVTNLCECLVEKADRGLYDASFVRRIREVDVPPKVYDGMQGVDPTKLIDIQMCDLDDVYQKMMKILVGNPNLISFSKLYFKTWMLSNVQKFCDLFEKRTNIKPKIEVFSLGYRISMSWK